MTSTAALIREIAIMEDIQRDIAAIAKREDGERKRDLIGLRRQLSEQMGRVSAEGDIIFGPGDPRIASAFRSHLSAMRSAIALHQANWPAVRLDAADDEYVRSALAARTAKDTFIAWSREALNALSRNHGVGP